MKTLNKKRFEEESKKFGIRELNEDDKKELKKAGFKFDTLELFNFYRGMKALVNCRKCLMIVRKSTRLKQFKTKATEAKEYCEKRLCVYCLKRTEKIREKY